MTYLNPMHSHAIMPLEYEETQYFLLIIIRSQEAPIFLFLGSPPAPQLLNLASLGGSHSTTSPLSKPLKANLPAVSLLSMSPFPLRLPYAIWLHSMFLNGSRSPNTLIIL